MKMVNERLRELFDKYNSHHKEENHKDKEKDEDKNKKKNKKKVKIIMQGEHFV